ncbi:glyoxalase [Rhodococcus spelaei]|uniref:Glyoxalase n=1 Tax=Rhodococcus spelaei TaxID=2546320 RepID=A0A541BRL4_9NOCA|nr:VOC family protein [Rhodococcus spelaei]TQF74954.1 glyoxalase [Rhodococcus spelaei]
MRIKMCSVHVVDPAAAFGFYTEILGFEELLAMPEHHLFIVKSPQDPDGVGLLLEPSDNPVAEAYRAGVYAQGLPAIVFGSPNVQADYERLSGLGVRFTGPPTADPSGTSAVFDDTCGNLVQLHQD